MGDSRNFKDFLSATGLVGFDAKFNDTDKLTQLEEGLQKHLQNGDVLRAADFANGELESLELPTTVKEAVKGDDLWHRHRNEHGHVDFQIRKPFLKKLNEYAREQLWSPLMVMLVILSATNRDMDWLPDQVVFVYESVTHGREERWRLHWQSKETPKEVRGGTQSRKRGNSTRTKAITTTTTTKKVKSKGFKSVQAVFDALVVVCGALESGGKGLASTVNENWVAYETFFEGCWNQIPTLKSKNPSNLQMVVHTLFLLGYHFFVGALILLPYVAALYMISFWLLPGMEGASNCLRSLFSSFIDGSLLSWLCSWVTPVATWVNLSSEVASSVCPTWLHDPFTPTVSPTGSPPSEQLMKEAAKAKQRTKEAAENLKSARAAAQDLEKQAADAVQDEHKTEVERLNRLQREAAAAAQRLEKEAKAREVKATQELRQKTVETEAAKAKAAAAAEAKAAKADEAKAAADEAPDAAEEKVAADQAPDAAEEKVAADQAPDAAEETGSDKGATADEVKAWKQRYTTAQMKVDIQRAFIALVTLGSTGYYIWCSW